LTATFTKQEIPLVDLRAQFAPLREEMLQAIAGVLDGMHLFLGPELDAFEREFASYCGCAHTIGISNGTDAIELALRALGVGSGDEVITQPNSFIATAEAISAVGATSIFVDVDPETATLDPNLLEAAITPRTKAVIPVHLYGRPADMDAILAIARPRGIWVIEDACQAHGAQIGSRRAGSLGDLACFSFYYSKNLGAYGEAGAVTTNDAALGERVRLFRDHGSRVRYHHEVVGRNARMDEIQAAILRIKLRHLDEWNKARRAHAARLSAALTGTSLALPRGDQPDTFQVFHLFVVQHPRRDDLQAFLAERGIGTGIHYPNPSARGVREPRPHAGRFPCHRAEGG
jgi:dTDP-4-amino-4,6-dideoxygalactose transaminase